MLDNPEFCWIASQPREGSLEELRTGLDSRHLGASSCSPSGEVGVVRSYDQLVGRYDAIPFTKKPSFDLRSYVTDKSLDGLFAILGEEERRIRTDPAARVTPLLQQVFGK